jgi:methionine-rich copper-binding protein CopC
LVYNKKDAIYFYLCSHMIKTVLIISLLLLIPQVSYPHAYLMETHPEEASELTGSPKQVTLHFLGFLEHVFSKVKVFNSAGSKVSKGTKLMDGEDGTVMGTKLNKDLTAGQYSVKWSVISKDGHKQNGSYKFTLK